MTLARPFRGFRFPAEAILWAMRWHRRFALGLRDLDEMLAERGVRVNRVSLHRWVQRSAPEIERRVRPRPRPPGRTWHVDGTCVRVGGVRRYLCRAVDGAGRTVEFLLSAARGGGGGRPALLRPSAGARPGACAAARRRRPPGQPPNVVRRAETRRPAAALRAAPARAMAGQPRRAGPPAHHATDPAHAGVQGVRHSARRALAGIEAVAMLAKGRARRVRAGDALAQRAFVLRLFGLAA